MYANNSLIILITINCILRVGLQIYLNTLPKEYSWGNKIFNAPIYKRNYKQQIKNLNNIIIRMNRVGALTKLLLKQYC